MIHNKVWSSLACVTVAVVFVVVAGSSTVVAAKEGQVRDKHLQEAREIFNWVSGSTDGFVTPKQDLRRADPEDINSPLGVYAIKRIEKGEVVVRIPWDTIIKSDDPTEEGQLCCGTVRSVAREMRLGNASKYAPYAMYLNNEPDDQIPSAWSNAAQDLFLEVLGNNNIPPEDPISWLTDDWRRRCNGNLDDKIAAKAALLVVQRADDAIMIPAYDAYNHRNGNWTNTKTIIEEGRYHETTATRTIEEGEQIMISYNMCEECPGRRHGYGTAGMWLGYVIGYGEGLYL
jgi:hypothetical protein